MARVDLKSDRAGSALLVRGSYAEDPVPEPDVPGELAAELVLMAGWLGLERVEVELDGRLEVRHAGLRALLPRKRVPLGR